MDKRYRAATDWEVAAARRREVIHAEVAARRAAHGEQETDPAALTAGGDWRSTLRSWIAGNKEMTTDELDRSSV